MVGAKAVGYGHMGCTQRYVHLSRQRHAMVDSYEMNGSWSGNLNSYGFSVQDSVKCRVMLVVYTALELSNVETMLAVEGQSLAHSHFGRVRPFATLGSSP